MKKKTKILSAVLGVVVLAAVLAGVYLQFGPKTQEGAKTVALEVVDDKGESVEYEVHTDAEYLLGVMEDAKEEGFTFHGEEGEMGMTIDTVNGLKADFNEGAAYWAFYVNDEYCNYGPEQQPAADGDAFKIEYSVWQE